MNKRTKDNIFFVLFLAAIGSIVIGAIGTSIWISSADWTDTGQITWSGQKAFGVNGWNTPYAITTLHHGTLNFTTAQNPLYINKYISASPSQVGSLPIGVVRYNSGDYQLEVDP